MATNMSPQQQNEVVQSGVDENEAGNSSTEVQNQASLRSNVGHEGHNSSPGAEHQAAQQGILDDYEEVRHVDGAVAAQPLRIQSNKARNRSPKAQHEAAQQSILDDDEELRRMVTAVAAQPQSIQKDKVRNSASDAQHRAGQQNACDDEVRSLDLPALTVAASEAPEPTMPHVMEMKVGEEAADGDNRNTITDDDWVHLQHSTDEL